jgi:Rrf2 family protein
MKITTNGRYSLRAMLDLALHENGQPVQRAEIAGRQAISAEFIAQLFRQLNKAGLVESVMGPGGGYRLGRPAETITVGDIIRAVEGPVAAVFCVNPAAGKSCPRIGACAAQQVWRELSQVIEKFLDSMTLERLQGMARELEAQGNPDCGLAATSLITKFDAFNPTGPDCPDI